MESFKRLEREVLPASQFTIIWQEPNVGFGQLQFYMGDDGTLRCSNELMSKQFIKQMLCHMVDTCVLDHPRKLDVPAERELS